jgi:hypothetical protein
MKPEKKEPTVKYLLHLTPEQAKELGRLKNKANRNKKPNEYKTSVKEIISKAIDRVIRLDRAKFKKLHAGNISPYALPDHNLENLTIVEPDSGE